MEKHNGTKRTVMRMAWILYNDSKWPWMFDRTFSDCLKEAWKWVRTWGDD